MKFLSKKKIILTSLIGLGLFGIALDYFDFVSYTIGDPISNLSLSLLVTTLVLLPFRDQIFRAWVKFAFWAFPLSILIVMIQPDGGGGYFPSLVTKEIVSWWIGILFFLTSLLIIAYKYFTLRKNTA